MKRRYLTYVIAGLVMAGVYMWCSSECYNIPRGSNTIECKKKGAGQGKRRERTMYAKTEMDSIGVNRILMTTTKKKIAM